jgi:hypothetical protein
MRDRVKPINEQMTGEASQGAGLAADELATDDPSKPQAKQTMTERSDDRAMQSIATMR